MTLLLQSFSVRRGTARRMPSAATTLLPTVNIVLWLACDLRKSSARLLLMRGLAIAPVIIIAALYGDLAMARLLMPSPVIFVPATALCGHPT